MAPCLDSGQLEQEHLQRGLDQEQVNSHQLLDAAIAAFDESVLPSGVAFSGHDGEAVRKRAERIVHGHGMGVLIGASEKLLAAVADLTGCRTVLEVLGRMPRLVARKTLMLGLGDAMPELLERQWLQARVDELQAKQISSTTTYLKELGALRSLLRQKVCDLKRSPSKRIRFEELEEPDTAQTPPVESSPLGDEASVGTIVDPQRSNEKRKTCVNVNIQTQSKHPLDADKREVNASFGNLHQYVWDPLDYVPRAMKPLVYQILAEKLVCFENQTIATSASELASLCRRIQELMKETGACKVQLQLDEALQTIEKQEEEIQGLICAVQRAKVESRECAAKFSNLKESVDKIEEACRMELVKMRQQVLEVEQQLEQARKEAEQARKELADIKAKKEEELWKKKQAAEERKKKCWICPKLTSLNVRHQCSPASSICSQNWLIILGKCCRTTLRSRRCHCTREG